MSRSVINKHYLPYINNIMQIKKELYLAAGCFWGAEHYLKQINGVTFTEVGFANGYTENPTYKEVYTDTTGYAETVHLRYDPLRVSLPFLLEMYFKSIDPTSLNQQGEAGGQALFDVWQHDAARQQDEHHVVILPEEFIHVRKSLAGMARVVCRRLLGASEQNA